MADEHLAMHAVLTKASATANSKGDKTYKVSFSHPPAFWQYLNEVLGMEIDVFWNEQPILRNAQLSGLKQKPVKDSDPEYIADLTCKDQDTALMNLLNEVNNSGDLRIAVPQGTLFSGPG